MVSLYNFYLFLYIFIIYQKSPIKYMGYSYESYVEFNLVSRGKGHLVWHLPLVACQI